MRTANTSACFLGRILLVLFLLTEVSLAQEQAGENASNPLSKGMNTDVRNQYFDLRDGSERYDYFVDAPLWPVRNSR